MYENEMIPNIEDLTEPPIVGEKYMVPCVFGTTTNSTTSEEFQWLPISGPMHSDEEYIGFDRMHYHYDHRFTPENIWSNLALTGGPLNTPNNPAFNVIVNHDKIRNIVYREMICLRESRGYPENADFKRELQEAYKDKLITSCGKCPHRGASLLNLPKDKNGNVTCPLHGLKWNLKSRRNVK